MDINEITKQNSKEEINIEEEKKKEDDIDILSYLKEKYPAEEYNADFCQYRYKFYNFYGINFWKQTYKRGSTFPTNRLFRRMILKVDITPDGPLITVDTDEGKKL